MELQNTSSITKMLPSLILDLKDSEHLILFTLNNGMKIQQSLEV